MLGRKNLTHNIFLPSWEYSFSINDSRRLGLSVGCNHPVCIRLRPFLSPLLFRIEHLPVERFRDAAKQVTTRKYATYERRYIFNERQTNLLVN